MEIKENIENKENMKLKENMKNKENMEMKENTENRENMENMEVKENMENNQLQDLLQSGINLHIKHLEITVYRKCRSTLFMTFGCWRW